MSRDAGCGTSSSRYALVINRCIIPFSFLLLHRQQLCKRFHKNPRVGLKLTRSSHEECATWFDLLLLHFLLLVPLS
jgi:hypothetical protein